MNAREAVRRAVIWGLVGVFFVLASLFFVTADSDGWWILLAWGGFPVVGATILNSRKANWVGRLLLFIGVGWAAFGALTLSEAARTVPVWIEVFAEATGYLVWIGVPFLVLVFPRGRVTTKTGRVLAIVGFALAGLMVLVAVLDPAPLELSGRERPWAVPALAPITTAMLDGGGFLIIPVFMVAALGELVRRWSRARGVERLQFRWFAFGVAVVAVALAVSEFLPEQPLPLAMATALCLNAIPISIGIAVTRHGLYEIGRVVSRTVSYAIVTLVVVAVYALVVTSATWLIPGAPSIAVAGATLAAAALFLPVLRWVQRRVDRRFDRERYDATRVVDAFGEKLRTGIDPASTAAELSTAVEEALQPASVGVWTVETKP